LENKCLAMIIDTSLRLVVIDSPMAKLKKRKLETNLKRKKKVKWLNSSKLQGETIYIGFV
jgi:deoxycytidylate deaminase